MGYLVRVRLQLDLLKLLDANALCNFVVEQLNFGEHIAFISNFNQRIDNFSARKERLELELFQTIDELVLSVLRRNENGSCAGKVSEKGKEVSRKGFGKSLPRGH